VAPRRTFRRLATRLERLLHRDVEAILLERDLVRQMLMMHPRSAHRAAHVHAVVEHVRQHRPRRGDDQRSFSRKPPPVTVTADPKPELIVVVSATALPAATVAGTIGVDVLRECWPHQKG
jgi:hypothetical protein